VLPCEFDSLHLHVPVSQLVKVSPVEPGQLLSAGECEFAARRSFHDLVIDFTVSLLYPVSLTLTPLHEAVACATMTSFPNAKNVGAGPETVTVMVWSGRHPRLDTFACGSQLSRAYVTAC
jgi:hypothetical protein